MASSIKLITQKKTVGESAVCNVMHPILEFWKPGMAWRELQCKRIERNGITRHAMESNEMVWNGNGMEWNATEWNGMISMSWNGMKPFAPN